MSLFRVGFLLLPLLLSACSSPLFNTTSAQGEQTSSAPTTATKAEKPYNTSVVDSKKTTEKVIETSVSEVKALKEKLDDLLQLAKKQQAALKVRSGQAPAEPNINMSQLTSEKAIENAMQSVRSYNSKVATKLAQLDALVETRRAAPQKGDMLKIFIHKANININNTKFITQPLIGQWVRGESRVIRLKDSILFDTKHSEDIKITYSNSYQILVNDQAISIVNPDREKNTAPFDVDTSQKDGKITGELDYSIVTNPNGQ